jgi:hypothetical protein
MLGLELKGSGLIAAFDFGDIYSEYAGAAFNVGSPKNQ